MRPHDRQIIRHGSGTEGHRPLFAGRARGDTVYLSGQIPLDPATVRAGRGRHREAQARRVFDNLKAVVAAAGGDASRRS